MPQPTAETLAEMQAEIDRLRAELKKAKQQADYACHVIRGELERLRTVAASDTDGGLGADIQWAVAEIDRLRAEVEPFFDSSDFLWKRASE